MQEPLMPLRSRRILFAVVVAILFAALLGGALWAMRSEQMPADPHVPGMARHLIEAD